MDYWVWDLWKADIPYFMLCWYGCYMLTFMFQTYTRFCISATGIYLYKFYDMHFTFFILFGIRSVKRASQHKLERSGKYFGKHHHLLVMGIPHNWMSVIYGGLSDLWIKCSSSNYNSGPTIEEITVLQGSEDGI